VACWTRSNNGSRGADPTAAERPAGAALQKPGDAPVRSPPRTTSTSDGSPPGGRLVAKRGEKVANGEQPAQTSSCTTPSLTLASSADVSCADLAYERPAVEAEARRADSGDALAAHLSLRSAAGRDPASRIWRSREQCADSRRRLPCIHGKALLQVDGRNGHRPTMAPVALLAKRRARGDCDRGRALGCGIASGILRCSLRSATGWRREVPVAPRRTRCAP
jgi:hypothetical protein